MSNRRGFNADARVKNADFAFRVLSDFVFTKGFLGRSLREDRGLPSVGVSSARRAGVIVDDNGKMRCPPGTPNANQFTDINMSNCMIPSAETLAQEAADAAKKAATRSLDGFKRGRFGIRPDSKSIPKASVGFANADGFLEQRRVPKGNSVVSPISGAQRQLNSIDDSALHVLEGGDLTDIPDEHLTRAILLNTGEGKRFSVIGTGGGINGMTRMKDSKTGALLGMKYQNNSPAQDLEAIREVAAELFLEHMGYEPMPMRIVPDVRENDWGGEEWNGVSLITELAHNRNGGNIESARISDRDGKYEYKVEPKEVLRMAILDSIIANGDRHEGNFMIARGEGGEGFIVPIDHSMAMGDSNDYGGMAELIARTPWGVGEQQILKQYFDSPNRDQMVADIKEIQDILQSIDTEKLDQQLSQLYAFLGQIGVSPSTRDRESISGVFGRLAAMSDKDAAEEISEKILPEMLRPAMQPSTISEWATESGPV